MNKTWIIILIILIIVAAGTTIYFSLPKPNMQSTPNQNQNQQNTANNQSAFNIQGMKVEILKQGTGDGAKTGDNIVVNYTGSLQNGKKFDSSVDPSFGHVNPFPYTLGQNQVIQGWELGLLGMKTGEERRLTIPPELAYGSQSPSPLIPANSTLVFDITMVSINGK